MIGMMIGVVFDMTIIGISIVMGPEEVEVTGGIDHHECRSYRLRSN
jgi:hypothetical protein